METSFLTICLILVGLIFIPFFLFNVSGKSNLKKVKETAKAVSIANHLVISQNEIWGNSYIGIDEKQQKILFLKLTAGEAKEQIISIPLVKECVILEQRKFFKVKDKKDSHLEKLDLKITLQAGSPYLLNFYDENLNFSEDFEAKRIAKWRLLISQLITNESLIQEVA